MRYINWWLTLTLTYRKSAPSDICLKSAPYINAFTYLLPYLLTWVFQRTHYWTTKIEDGCDPPSWKSTWRHFSADGGLIWIKFRWYVDWGDMVKIETRSRIPIWRTLGRIPWHVIPELPATLQGVIIPSAILKIVFRHIFCFFVNAVWALMSCGFRIVSDRIHLLSTVSLSVY